MRDRGPVEGEHSADRRRTKPATVMFAWSLLLAALLAAFASQAAAAEVGGLVPDVPTGTRLAPPPAAHAASLGFDGGPVMHSNRTHLIFWQPEGSGLTFEPGYVQLIETFLARVAADSHLPSNVYSLSGQYRDSRGPAAHASSYAGAIVDSDPLPVPSGCAEPPPPPVGSGPDWTACVSDQQIQTEVSTVVTTHSLPVSPSDLYFLVTPNGLGDCQAAGPDNCALGGRGTGYCGYHSVTDQTGILYAVIPYNAVPGHCQSGNPRPNSSTADPTISTLSHEHSEAITDPLGSAWIDGQGNENGDLCLTDFGPNLNGSTGSTAYNELIDGGHYYLQEEWSNDDGSSEQTACQPRDESDPISLRAPTRVVGDRFVPFSAVASDPDGKIARYDWLFGDGGRARRPQATHVFTVAGRFVIVLKTTDSAENWGLVFRSIRVLRPPRPHATITGRPPLQTRHAAVRFTFSSTAAIASFQCRLDLDPWRRCRSPFRARALRSGGHTFLVRARDTFGQLSPVALHRFTLLA